MARNADIILDDDDPPPRRPKDGHDPSRASYEIGLASTLVGATLLIAAMLAPLTSRMLHFDPMGRPESNAADSLSYFEILGLIGAEAFCLAGVIFGMRGLAKARSEKAPKALPVAGIMLGLGAAFLWLLVAIALLGGSRTW